MAKKTFVAIMIVMLFCGLTLEASAKPEVIELKFSSTVPPMNDLGMAQVAWIKKVEKETGGKVKFVPFWANSLLKPREILRGVMANQVEMAFYVTNIDLGMMKLNTVTALPMMGFPSQKSVGDIHVMLMEKFPEMKAEFRGIMTYGLVSFTPAQLNTIGKQVVVPSDMKGMKIAPSSPDVAQLVLGGGGTPVNLTVTDWYSSAEKGLVDGFVNVMGALIAFKVMDLMEYHTLLRPGGISMSMSTVLVNPDAWNDLPADVQKVFKDNEAFYIDMVIKNAIIGTEKAVGFAKSKGHKITYLTPDDKEWALWEKASLPVHEQWIENNKNIGGKEVYEETLRLIKAYKNQ